MMKAFALKSSLLVACLCAALAGAFVVARPAPSKADGVQFAVTPYLWLPTINGHAAFDTSTLPGNGKLISCSPLCEIDAQIGPNNYLSKLNSAIMLAAEARKGRWELATDIINTNLTSSAGSIQTITGPFGRVPITIHSNFSARMTGTIWTLEGGYSIFQDKMFNTDFIGGFRSTALTVRGDYDFGGNFGLFGRSGNFAGNTGPFDWIVGLKGRVNLTDKLYLPYYFDVGSGTNSSTAQELIGIGYGKRGSAELLFRNIAYTTTNTAVTNARLGGPAVGYTFRF